MTERKSSCNINLCVAVLVAAASLIPCTAADAQVTTATIYGMVRDSTGSVLPGVNVTVRNQGTNLSRETLTDERGEFALPALPIGPYTLQIELQGFKTYTNDGLHSVPARSCARRSSSRWAKCRR